MTEPGSLKPTGVLILSKVITATTLLLHVIVYCILLAIVMISYPCLGMIRRADTVVLPQKCGTCWKTIVYIVLNNVELFNWSHYGVVIMSAMASQITDVSIVCSSIGWGTDQRKHQSSASLAFVSGNHRWLADSPHKGPVPQKMFPFGDVIMKSASLS